MPVVFYDALKAALTIFQDFSLRLNSQFEKVRKERTFHVRVGDKSSEGPIPRICILIFPLRTHGAALKQKEVLARCFGA